MTLSWLDDNDRYQKTELQTESVPCQEKVDLKTKHYYNDLIMI